MKRGVRAGIRTTLWQGFEFHFDVAWMRRVGVAGIVIGRHVCFSRPADKVPRRLFRHELEHAYQQMRDGRLRFYLKYFWYNLRHGYWDNPYEVEAREMSDQQLDTIEEDLLWKLRGD